jgi:hypothetical protein
VPAFFSFQLDAGDLVYRVSPASGVVPPLGMVHATATFTAPAAAHHWRRLACLVKVSVHHPLPLPSGCESLDSPWPNCMQAFRKRGP